MRIAYFQWPVNNPYNKETIEIYFQGCLRDTCTGLCHNPEIKIIDGGEEWSIEKLMEYLENRKRLIDCISFTGGDPLYQDLKELRKLVMTIRSIFPDKELWLFTGENEWDNIPGWCKKQFNYIKFGGYMKEAKQEGFPASSNQKVVECRKS